MDNFLLKKEAIRVTKELVKIKESNKSLDEVFHNILDKKYKKNDMEILVYITGTLYDEGYSLESAVPFKLKKI